MLQLFTAHSGGRRLIHFVLREQNEGGAEHENQLFHKGSGYLKKIIDGIAATAACADTPPWTVSAISLPQKVPRLTPGVITPSRQGARIPLRHRSELFMLL
jgi:hypothetical protein